MRRAVVKSLREECGGVFTLRFALGGDAAPGQFAMLWLPGAEELPMSLSHISRGEKGVTFKVVGDGTRALSKAKTGARIGVKAPLGRGYSLRGRRILFVAGGTGIASLAPAVEMARRAGKKATVILGAKTSSELFFADRIRKAGASLHITTDDGSAGERGFATVAALHLLKNERFDGVLACGPEPMLRKVAQACSKLGVECQCSVERYMKCGLGLCGACDIGGLRVCADGPVFSGEALLVNPDFGKRRRLKSGKHVSL